MNRIVGFAAIGFLTGLLETYLVRGDDETWFLLLGILFGLPVAMLLWFQGLSLFRVLALIAGFAASWRAAYWCASNIGARIHEEIGEPATYTLSGVVGGFVGAVILVLTFRLLLGKARSASAMQLVSLGGAIFGAVLIEAAYLAEATYLFIIWQTVVGALLGWAWPTPEAAHRG